MLKNCFLFNGKHEFVSFWEIEKDYNHENMSTNISSLEVLDNFTAVLQWKIRKFIATLSIQYLALLKIIFFCKNYVFESASSDLRNLSYLKDRCLLSKTKVKIKNEHCVKSVRIWRFSDPYFPSLGLNTERYKVYLRIQSKCGKIRTR